MLDIFRQYTERTSTATYPWKYREPPTPPPSEIQEDWVVSTTMWQHGCKNRNLFTHFIPEKGPINGAPGQQLDVQGYGDVPYKTHYGYSGVLQNVLYIPSLADNQFSVYSIGGSIKFAADNTFTVASGDSTIYLSGPLRDGIPILSLYHDEAQTSRYSHSPSPPYSPHSPVSGETDATANVEYDLWHRRCGHIDLDVMQMMASSNNSVVGFPQGIAKLSPCDSCRYIKQTQREYEDKISATTRVSEKLDTVHVDIYGPLTSSYHDNKYFLVLVDESSMKVFVRKFKKIRYAVTELSTLVDEAEKAGGGKRISCIWSNGEKEFGSYEMRKFISKKKCVHRVHQDKTKNLATHTAERLHQKMEAMMNDFKVKMDWWTEGVLCASYLHNRTPLRELKWRTPYEVWTQKKPNIEHLRVFGSEATTSTSKKEKFIHVGYDEDTDSYDLLNEKEAWIYPRSKAYFNESK